MQICKYSKVTNSYNKFTDLDTFITHLNIQRDSSVILVTSNEYFSLIRGEIITAGVDPKLLSLISVSELLMINLVQNNVYIFVEHEAFRYLEIKGMNLVKRDKPIEGDILQSHLEYTRISGRNADLIIMDDF